MLWRLSLSSSILATVFVASSAFAQEPTIMPPPDGSPTTSPTPPVPPMPPRWEGAHDPHGVPAPTSGGAPMSNVPGPTNAQMEGRRVHTTIEAGAKNAVLERSVSSEESSGRFLFLIPFHSDSEKWEQVCVAPCRVDLDRYSSYRVARANDVTATHEFTLPPNADQLHLTIEPGNLMWHRLGKALIGAGTATTITGAALISTASQFDTHPSEKHVRLAGIITGAIGVVFLGVGIPLAILTQTHVRADDGRSLAKTNTKPHLTLDGLVF